MKRLLAYLFIVLGISITLNSSASAKIVFCEIIFITFDNKVIKAGESGSFGKKYDVEPVYFNQDKCFFASGYMGQNKIDHPQINFKKYVEKLTNYKMRKGSSAAIIGTGGSSVKVDIARSLIHEFLNNNFDTSYLISLLEKKYKVASKDLPKPVLKNKSLNQKLAKHRRSLRKEINLTDV